MGSSDWVDWSFSFTTSFFNPALKIIAVITILISIVIFTLARVKFKDFKDLSDVINLLIISSILIFLGFFFRLFGDFVVIWKYLESTFNFAGAIMFMLTAFRFIYKIMKSEKVAFKIDIALIILICGAIWAVIFWGFLSSPSISTGALNLEYEESVLSVALRLMCSLAFIMATYLLMKGREKYEGSMKKMIQILVFASFFIFLGTLGRDHGTNLGFNSDASLKWFQSIFFIIGGLFLIYSSYIFYDTGKKFKKTLQ